MNEWKRIYRITNGYITIEGDYANSKRDGVTIEYRLSKDINEIENVEDWLSRFDYIDNELHQLAHRGYSMFVQSIVIDNVVLTVNN